MTCYKRFVVVKWKEQHENDILKWKHIVKWKQHWLGGLLFLWWSSWWQIGWLRALYTGLSSHFVCCVMFDENCYMYAKINAWIKSPLLVKSLRVYTKKRLQFWPTISEEFLSVSSLSPYKSLWFWPTVIVCQRFLFYNIISF